ncbi:hypothetical protein RHGRI_012893 [Rhododendron griersonianum]|uniref:Uncharacterized protein n=1 Tax=Rhododendron griersonianum TaxID=479676 RepID=A0AAV6K3P1_9ERIC|nr:hypothetical protein RHGRI_012893 [Rhododendron griersonianum]
MKLPSDCSWTIRKLMKLRGLGQGFVKHIIGDGQPGQGTFLWLNNWHPKGPLYKLFGDRALDNLDRNINAKASSIILNGQWNWPRPSSNLTSFGLYL